mgnify:CR=1 FL=1
MVTLRLPLVLLTLTLLGCEEEITYDRLNVEDDCLSVVLSPDGDDDDSAGDDDDSAVADDGVETIDLHAVPGFFDRDVIGTASVTPSRGPAVETVFSLSIVLVDTRTQSGNPVDVVDRATLMVDNGEVTLNEFDLDESPADDARWVIQLGTGGDAMLTRRTDSLCVALYSESE